MKKILLFMLFVILLPSIRSFGQDTIFWSPINKLTWDDFRGIVPDTSIFNKNEAISRPGIKYYLSANEDSFTIKVICFFIKSKSWTKTKNVDILLQHEQGHFDIAELFARKLRKSFAQYKFNYRTVSKDIDSIFLLNKAERNRMDSLYDLETNHSQNKEQQLLWNDKLKVELDKFKAYASS